MKSYDPFIGVTSRERIREWGRAGPLVFSSTRVATKKCAVADKQEKKIKIHRAKEKKIQYSDVFVKAKISIE
jgi:hypothetical protein